MSTQTLPAVVVDTNVLINSPEILLDGKFHYIIPYTVLQELDNNKRKPELNAACRYAIKIIYQQIKAGLAEITNVPTDYSTNDEKIVKVAKNNHCPILTDDIGARAVALARHVEVLEDDTVDSHEHYTGYQTILGDEHYEKHWVALKEVQPAELFDQYGVTLAYNEFLIVNRVINREDLWVRKTIDGIDKIVRVPQSSKPLKDANIMITPIDVVQAATVAAVMDKDIPLTVIEGPMGSAKTISSLMGALACTIGQKQHMHYRKIMVTRPNLSIDRRLDLGFLPGETANKFGPWLGGIISNLKFMYERTQEDAEMSKAQTLFDMHFEMLPLETLQGLSLHDSIVLVDEYQLLSRDMLKMILSRIAKGSKIVLIGDTHDQTYGINRGVEGFKVIHEVLGEHPLMNYIRLSTIHRSELTELVNQLFKKA
jgi:PhoH-like ATPase